MIEVFYSDIKGDEHEYGHALARYALHRSFGSEAEPIFVPNKRTETNIHGTYLNISHSMDICAVAVADLPVGLDIELNKRDFEHLNRLAKRFFSRDEYEYVKCYPEKRFYEVWCKKESYVKYTGEGFSRAFKSFSVFELSECFSAFEINGYYGCVCSEKSEYIKPIFVDNADFSTYLSFFHK